MTSRRVTGGDIFWPIGEPIAQPNRAHRRSPNGELENRERNRDRISGNNAGHHHQHLHGRHHVHSHVDGRERMVMTLVGRGGHAPSGKYRSPTDRNEPRRVVPRPAHRWSQMTTTEREVLVNTRTLEHYRESDDYLV